MSEASGGAWAFLASRPWRPRSIEPPGKYPPGMPWRVSLLVVIALLHLGALRGLGSMRAAQQTGPAEEVVLVLDFTDQPSRPAPLLPIEETLAPAEPVSRSKSRHETAQPRRVTSTNKELPATSVQPSTIAADGPMQLYEADGRVRTPKDLLEQLDRQFGDKRVFSYQIPHMDDARKYFYRPRALTYEYTRFEQYWKPDQDMLTELLTRLVEETTKEISISIPGQPGSKVVCSISLLALGGGCGVVNNGDGYVGRVDDPDTLNPEEDRQCQAWWEQIVGAKTQELWRKTRSLYEAQCRKPLARPS